MKKILLLTLGIVITLGGVTAQKKNAKVQEPEGYVFTDIKTVATSPVKDQSRSGTCWSYASNAFLESELIRTGKEGIILSDMWIVRNAYIEKAIRYIRYKGENNFPSGGAGGDVFTIVKKYGHVPEEAYRGLNYGHPNHNHSELDHVLAAYMKGVAANKGKTLTTAWLNGFIGILDAYLGPAPEKFIYKGKEYTPKTFAQSLGLNMDDYVSFTSFTHHPFYTQFAVEVPDNWNNDLSYNLPLNEFISLLEGVIDNGYTWVWGADVSEKGFAYRKGFAVVPEVDMENMDGTEQAKWVALTEKEKEDALYKLEKPGKEKTITQELRQKSFDNYETTDDHGMQVVGIATDQNGTKYFKVKNSWGTNQLYNGYFYASYPYVEYKTINVMVNKNSVPEEIAKKVGLK